MDFLSGILGGGGGGGQPKSSASAVSGFNAYPAAAPFDWQPVIVLAAVAGLVFVAALFLKKL
jgi:hypothetical protein